MKKILLLLLFCPSILFAQIINNRYKLKLANDNLVMELTNSNFIRVTEDCRDRTLNCGSQVWFISGLRGKPNTYQIALNGTGKYLTWNDPTEDVDNLVLTLQPRYPGVKLKYQQFIFTLNDKGSYQIQPAIDAATTNEYYLGASLVSGGNSGVGLFKKSVSNVRNAWVFAPPITPLPAQASPSVIVAAPSSNKLDVDIRTGGDNLEQRNHQENPEITVEINGLQNIVFSDINRGQTWVNNSFHRITIPLPASVRPEDLKSITIARRTKPSGMEAMAASDNWTVASVAVVANINNKRIPLANYITARPYNKVFRFKAIGGGSDETGQPNSIYGYGQQVKLPLPQAPTTTPASSSNENSGATTLTAVFGTGGDDLRGGNDNLNILIRLKIRPVRNIVLNNFNSGRNWRNFSEKTLTKTIAGAPFTFDDIEDIVLRHTGGGGIGADNWYLDKLKISLTIAGETRVLVDQISAPIHYFTGDTRSKTFQIIK